MRGNAWRTTDNGKNWARVGLGDYKGPLQGASELPEGVALVGADGLIAISRDGGATFEVKPDASRATITAVLRTAPGWIIASPSGLRVVP